MVDNIQSLFSTIALGAVRIVFGAIAAICIIYSGVLFLTASGDVTKLKTARAALLWGIVGIVVGTFAYISIAFFGNLLN